MPDGRETRYAHMSRFAANTAVGTPVKAGDIIGYIGTTGLSTGPHLHFELYLNSQAIDPLGTVGSRYVGDPTTSAVETLTDRIIQRRKRRQRPRQESAVVGDRPWPVHLVYLDPDDEHLPA